MHAHLEGVSRKLLEEYRDVIRQYFGRHAGIYALYRRNELYYVGLAKTLRSRLKTHLRSKKPWDRFSIYLTSKDQHLRELEALALRIASPEGAKQKGKLAQSRDMRRSIQRAIREKARNEMTSLFSDGRSDLNEKRAKNRSSTNMLARLLPYGAILRAKHKGNVFRARARRDGRIRFNGSYYPSLSKAATAAINRTVNGWWFWRVKRGGQWVRLTAIRRAGTPLLGR